MDRGLTREKPLARAQVNQLSLFPTFFETQKLSLFSKKESKVLTAKIKEVSNMPRPDTYSSAF